MKRPAMVPPRWPFVFSMITTKDNRYEHYYS
jgi:hypothetical protein